MSFMLEFSVTGMPLSSLIILQIILYPVITPFGSDGAFHDKSSALAEVGTTCKLLGLPGPSWQTYEKNYQ